MTDRLTFDDVTLLDIVDSTNDAVKRRLRDGPSAPFLVAAREQTKGRGRSGRVWSSRPGNLAVTYYYPFEGSHQDAARLSFAVSLAVRDALCQLAPMAEIKLKWPNDVLMNRKKVCGILLENLGHDAARRLQLLIGIGINLRHHPDPKDSNWPATSMDAETVDTADFQRMLDTLTGALTTRLRSEARTGFDATRKDWLKHAIRLGDTIEVRLPTQQLHGVFREIDSNGALVLETASGVRTITAGDVFFPEGAECC